MREINAQTLEDLLDNLQGFIENELKEFRLPVKRDGTWKHEPVCRSVEVSQMVMPEPDEDHERVPYKKGRATIAWVLKSQGFRRNEPLDTGRTRWRSWNGPRRAGGETTFTTRCRGTGREHPWRA